MGKPRILIFVIAYQAESTLQWVLERIPPDVLESFDCEILVVDDASTDRTFEIGRSYQQVHPDVKMTVLRNSHNQGYGGNQKVGYAYAIEHGFDFVAMVHGDGQYAPEELPRLLEPMVADEADAVFGSRMLVRGAALRGGMPLYKFVGNRILTTAQNFLLRADLSEFHSGYRIYRVRTLAQLHFRLNSNDFHFDTEIIIQLMQAGARIRELSIPTYYGDEISRVNGLKYAANVMLATVGAAFHRVGVLHQRRLDPMTVENSHYSLKLDFPSTHSWTVAAIESGAKVLDMGAGPGGLAVALVKKGCQVTVVDQFEARMAPPDVDVIVADLDDEVTFDPTGYDYLLLLDVIEHLRDPDLFIERLRGKFGFEPQTMILTTPNIAFIIQRVMLALGQFNYGQSGILDRTHVRLFTFRSIKHLLRDNGFVIDEVRGVPAPFPKAFGDNAFSRLLVSINLGLIRLSKTLFSYQIYVRCRTTPDVSFVLRDSKRSAQR
jgi:glycosyltransferase involved in cell wall biosynthesis